MSSESELYGRLLEKEAMNLSPSGKPATALAAALTLANTTFTPTMQSAAQRAPAQLGAAAENALSNLATLRGNRWSKWQARAEKNPFIVTTGGTPPIAARKLLAPRFDPRQATAAMGNVAFPKAGALRKQATIATMARFGLR